jgi:hypothetical protein
MVFVSFVVSWGSGRRGAAWPRVRAGAVADEEPESGGAVVDVHQQVPGLLGGPRPGRVTGHTENVHVAGPDLQGEEHVDPFQGDRAVDVKEVQASMVDACARRNRRHDVSVARSGAGGTRLRLRILRIGVGGSGSGAGRRGFCAASIGLKAIHGFAGLVQLLRAAAFGGDGAEVR